MEKQIVTYKPYTDRTPDHQYHNLLTDLFTGEEKTSFHAGAKENENSGHKYCLELPARMLQFNVANGAPITPIRDLGKGIHGSLGEMLGFIDGAHTLAQLIEYGCPKKFWTQSVTKEKCAVWGLEEGDLGPGSYGPNFTALPTHNGGIFNQITALTNQIISRPKARTNLIGSWYTPLDMGDETQNSPRKVVVAPCHGNLIQFDVMDNMNMHMSVYQRSSDSAVGLVYNLTEWFGFGLMVAYIGNLNFTWYSHFLPNPQIYDIQFDAVRELLTRPAKPLPSLYLRPKGTREKLTDFCKEDFVLEDYYPDARMDVPSVV